MNHKISFLKQVIKAVNQAAANINCEPELCVDKSAQKKLVKQLLKDDRINSNIRKDK